MKRLIDNDTIQIEITSYCRNRCANCTRFVGLVKPYIMSFNAFKTAVDSLIDFPHMIGMMGGEPLLHPEFSKFCDYALSKINRERLGLWTSLPAGFEYYREVICRTFGNIFINDHSLADIHHHPFLIASQDIITDRYDLFNQADKCYFQDAWSPSINPRGAYFCEIAASLAMLYPNLSNGWSIDSNWWKRSPKDYKKQIEEFCPLCGGCLYLPRRPSINDAIYDVSKTHLKIVKDEEANYALFQGSQIQESEQLPLASYKDQNYRNIIASRYGIFLSLNANCFNEPYLMKDKYDPESILLKYSLRYK